MILDLRLTNFIGSCRSYDDIFRVWFFQIISKSFFNNRNFLLRVCTYWCKDIIELFCYFNWVSDSIIISNYGIYITVLFFMEDMILCIPCHIALKSFYSPQNDVVKNCNWTRTQNHLVLKRTLNHLAKLAKRLSCVLSTYLYGAFDCMFLSCHVRVWEWIHTL